MAPGATASRPCKHKWLSFLCSPHFGYTEYKPCSLGDLQDAALTNKRRPSGLTSGHSWAFPGPLVLPGDDLEYDPEWPQQSLREWQAEPERNAVSKSRRTIYLCAPPVVEDEVVFVTGWKTPHIDGKQVNSTIRHPRVSDVANYLSAFYHGLPVRILDEDLRFKAWDENPPRKRRKTTEPTSTQRAPDVPEFIGLATSKECVRIRVRKTRDDAFVAQLNLNDVLDVAISMLPEDAYALLMIVEQDIYECDEDDFCCGRAYGGSRIAVVSSARYHPAFDNIQGVDRTHAWPASHCSAYMQTCCKEAECEHASPPKYVSRRAKKAKAVEAAAAQLPPCDLLKAQPSDSPLHLAVSAHDAAHLPVKRRRTAAAQDGLWLGRVCKTASHELGHCFGMDHCVYYACIMQGTASLAEDARQPPYLCPVDQAKVMLATGSSLQGHCDAMKKFCKAYRGIKLFDAFCAWLAARKDAGGSAPEEEGLDRLPLRPGNVEVIEFSD